MKYPWRGVIVDGIKLDQKQEKQFLKDISERMRANRRVRRSSILWYVTFISSIVLGALIGSFLAMNASQLAPTPRFLLILSVNGSFAFIGCYLSVRLHRHIYARHMRQTMQTLGYELCLACGYWLKGLDDTTDRCPECGTKREPLTDPPNDE